MACHGLVTTNRRYGDIPRGKTYRTYRTIAKSNRRGPCKDSRWCDPAHSGCSNASNATGGQPQDWKSFYAGTSRAWSDHNGALLPLLLWLGFLSFLLLRSAPPSFSSHSLFHQQLTRTDYANTGDALVSAVSSAAIRDLHSPVLVIVTCFLFPLTFVLSFCASCCMAGSPCRERHAKDGNLNQHIVMAGNTVPGVLCSRFQHAIPPLLPLLPLPPYIHIHAPLPEKQKRNPHSYDT